jgi:hypothetical protein
MSATITSITFCPRAKVIQDGTGMVPTLDYSALFVAQISAPHHQFHIGSPPAWKQTKPFSLKSALVGA